ncbi:FliM/FliN family flagellar motor switch protein [Pseudomonas sp. RGM2987]|uniref:FliM/FliN family flagellar motor switch protein n=1 Tax=Pseudomonas sp. RGM2987 TaxID=2930090 RepID=UPI001FD63349|nr:FliM/FliN family flagellar motor switch protein [Pseudomonas sp. RGM2987]MCJ8204791.1 FliM/FliN family flagellar motor switch protein [Pseudomonas sp. RGM2987]
MSELKLRRVDPLAHAHAQAIQRWRHAGNDAGLGTLPVRPGYLRFCAEGDSGCWHGLVMARDWLHQSLPALHSLLLRECPLPSIVELFRTVARPLPLAVDELRYSRLSDIEPVAPTQLPTHEVPWLQTSRGRLWLTRLPIPVATPAPLKLDPWLNSVPMRLVLILGASQLSVADRIRLAEGDVLRIQQQTRHCLLAERCLGVFTFTQEGLHMQSSDASPEGAPPPTVDIDLGSLPVRLEFVLATHEVDLASLAQIIAGQLIPLPEDAAQHIEVRANGKSVAQGELVQLDGQLGVELLKVYRSSAGE